jgi:myo-inositol catabolism protein IolC
MSVDPSAFSTGGLKNAQRSLVPELAEACRRHGKSLVFGLLANDLARFNARRSADFPIFAHAEEAVDAAAALRDWWRFRHGKGGAACELGQLRDGCG